jgi:hypothetical protein
MKAMVLIYYINLLKKMEFHNSFSVPNKML